MKKLEENAEIFVKNLLDEGAQTPCDDTMKNFEVNENLPPFYDEELFKKGQAFFHRNIFAVFAAKLFGLITILAIPSILKILIHTKMSGTDMTAYRRYVATILHMCVWYDSDFKPGSKLWKSITQVKNLHNSASNRGCKAGLHRISQKDMALTQFGFMGYQLTRSNNFGIRGSNEEWRAFVHLWRVVGYVLGIEDRFNICRDSVEETKAICEKLIQKIFIPAVNRKDKDTLQMSKYLVHGLWTIGPLLNFNVTMISLDILLKNDLDRNSEDFKKLTFLEKCLFYFTIATFYSLRWTIFRWYFNHTRSRDLWLTKNFPFLAYYKFGFRNATVRILGKYD